ncbi:hypothetical protein GCM10010116_48600 [Microbispora rosea subsp. aerata]|nr:hypothetical protein [Microbispora rosea]GGO24147.1 hypothetical protein GCM10010116_48600 [Microbispora rosea subsp. aerata]GIH57904.1 hypothetical protein Mro02_48180 [Microbispora rosea subsp. aerata]GLJ86116.1 hypothetical protein GCM10017588_48490 [Microbispora rosea subsp. aerata]
MRGLRGGRDESGASPATADGPQDGNDDGDTPSPQGHGPDGLVYEALGRVMAALSGEAETLEACRDLTWWRGTGRSWHIEWRDGPYAAEVATLLLEGAGVPPPDVRPAGPATASTAMVDMMGVTFVLRAIDPFGMDRLRSRPGLWRLSAALDGPAGPVGTGGRSRRHWEELLGG